MLSYARDFNQRWAQHAAELIYFAVRGSTLPRSGKAEPQFSRSHFFDSGAAWANPATRIRRLGLHTPPVDLTVGATVFP